MNPCDPACYFRLTFMRQGLQQQRETDTLVHTHMHKYIERGIRQYYPQGFFWVKCLEMYENSTKSLCLSLHYKKYCWFNLKNEVTWVALKF